MSFEFLFHNKRVVVEDLEAELVIENNKLLTLIEESAPERTLVKQERVVNRLRDLVERPSKHANRTADAQG